MLDCGKEGHRIDVNVRDWLPHRYPFLLVDSVCARDPGSWVRGSKNITAMDWFHGAGASAAGMPHMLVVECVAQLSSFVHARPPQGLGLLAGLSRVRFEREATAGDRLDIYFELLRERGRLLVGRGNAKVKGRTVVSVGELLVITACRASGA